MPHVPSARAPADAICVLGFHRSGTSLTTRALQLLGVELGPDEDLLPPHEADNPEGYWEPRWMNDLNDEVLEAIDASLWYPLRVEDDWATRPELSELRSRAAAVIQDKFGAAGQWAVKDPRLCLTLPFWKQVVPHMRYVICLRSPEDAIASSLRRGESALDSRWAWGQLWLEYTGRALAETETGDRLLVNYDGFFADPQREVGRFADFVGAPAAARDRAVEAIRGDLRHHGTSPVEVADDAELPVEARGAYLALRAAHAAEDEDVRRAHERIARELWTAHRERVAERERLEQRARELEAELERVKGDREAILWRAEFLDEQLEAIRGSRSWRWTAGLRRIGGS